MRTVENECCGCATPAYPCIGERCPRRHVTHYFCDDCGTEHELDELHDICGKELCLDCIRRRLKTGQREGEIP